MSMFTFYFNQSGAARKPFVKAVSGILGVKPKYLGMPSAAYEIDVVTITKEGNIELDDRTDTELVENLIDQLATRGYEAEPVEDSESDEQTTEDAEAEVEDINAAISVPRSALTDIGLENLKKLVWAKDALLQQAFNTESTEIDVREDAISFPWFDKLQPEELQYAAQFISGLCRFANESKRVTCRPHHEDNPKFAMRVWAIRMGFGGSEFKGLRKYILRNLPGDAAFRYGRREQLDSMADEAAAQ